MRATSGSPGASAHSGRAPVDTWQAWWETNKFDFIRLRRLEDEPWTGQGRTQETPEQRVARLAAAHAQLRSSVLPLLRQLTDAEDPAVRAAAIVALGKIRDNDSASLARRLLRDASQDVRWAAMLALGVLDSGQPSYLLMSIADDTPTGRALLGTTRIEDAERGAALLSSTLRGADAPGVLLQRLLDEPDSLPSEVLAAACEAAGLLGSPRAIDRLVRVAQDEQRPEFVRSAAVSALGRISDPSVVPWLVAQLEGGLEPRRAAALALGSAAEPGMAEAVLRLIVTLREEKDAPTRHFAAVSLGRIGGARAREALLADFADAPSDMRPWLALALGLLERQEPTQQIPALLAQLARTDGNQDTVAASLIALGLSRSEQALPVLREALTAASVHLSSQAAVALGLSGHPDALPALQQALAVATSPQLQSQLALGLGILGNGVAIPDLLELIRTTNNPFVASFAALGVAFLGDDNAVGPLLRIVEKSGTRGVAATYAVAAVGQLFDSDRRPALSRLAAGDNHLARSSAVRQLLALGF